MTPVQYVVHTEEMKNAYKIRVSNSEGNRALSIPWHACILAWIHLDQGAVK